MKRAIEILERMNDRLITDIGDTAIDYGVKQERTFNQQAEILALLQVSTQIEETIKKLQDFEDKP